jgi:hypothetical protein
VEQARAHYPAALKKVQAIRADIEEDGRRRKALNVPDLPKAPKGCILFGAPENVVGSVNNWLEHHVRDMNAPGTYKFYQDCVELHLLPIMRTWPLTDEVMTAQRLREVLKDTLYAKKVSYKRREACKAVLSAYFGWAIVTLPAGQLTRNPMKPPGAAVGEPGYKFYIRHKDEKDIRFKKIPNPMTRTQYEALLVWIKEHRPRFYLRNLLMGDVGPRVGEVDALKEAHLSLDQTVPQAHICDAFSGPKRQMELEDEKRAGTCSSRRLPDPTSGEKNTKNSRQNQYVDLTSRVVVAMKEERRFNLALWMVKGRPGKEPQHVSLNSKLRPRRQDKYANETFRAGCDALHLRGADGREFDQGDLRDTFATLSILDGKHIGWVANQMGDDEDTVKEHYYKWIRMTDDSPLHPAKKDTR